MITLPVARTLAFTKTEDHPPHTLQAALFLLSAWDLDLFTHSALAGLDMFQLAPEEESMEWCWAGLLHDIGKITISPMILAKPSSLSEGEMKTMQQHSLRGAQLLRNLGAPPIVVDGAKFHHERWDGSGYPHHLCGVRIPLIARMLAIVDAYATLTSDRPYRRAVAPAQARLEIARNAGTQFDPNLVDRFLKEKANDQG